MKTDIFLPKTIKVGYQQRVGTYTGKLAYVIYYDAKNKLRKEKSWNGWRDNRLGDNEFENVPTEGFVLNKSAGGATGWRNRNTYIRVYDPRGFEIEISVDNLLYIIEHANSIKGKGLEGEFIYGWDGAELVLMPTSSPEYEGIAQYNKMVHEDKKVYVKDLELGGTYRTKDGEDYVYLGRHDKWEIDDPSEFRGFRGLGSREFDYKNVGKRHYFGRMEKRYQSQEEYYNYLEVLCERTPTTKFMSIIDKEESEDYKDMLEELQRERVYSPVNKEATEYIEYTEEEIRRIYEERPMYFEAGITNERLGYEKEPAMFHREYKSDGTLRYGISDWTGRGEKYVWTEEEFLANNKVYYIKRYLENGNLYENTYAL